MNSGQGVWAGEIEIRQAGGGRQELTGQFPYNSTATIADRGRVRKERFAPGAFRYALLAKISQETIGGAVQEGLREIHLLRGHSYDQPLASRNQGSLELQDTPAALQFSATLPPESEQPTWMRDTLLSIRAGLMLGISPGFTIPAAGVVAAAQAFTPERGNSGVLIRVISHAVLHEMSIVTRPAYRAAKVNLRGEDVALHDSLQETRARIWLLH